jgi:ribosomal protein S18 acetylase RimI-like enzyme
LESLVITPASFDNPADAAAIVEIVNAYALEPQGGGKSLPDDVLKRIVPGMAAVPGAFTLLARSQGRPVGAAICFRGFSTFAGRPLVNVHDLSVLKEHRGQGIGARLLQAVEASARAQGCCKVTLEVREVNPLAEKLYRRLGYGDPSGFATRFLDKPLGE